MRPNLKIILHDGKTPGKRLRFDAFTTLSFISLIFFGINSLSAQTNLPSGDITGNSTWNEAGSPYTASGDITVVAGVTLTIEPGVVIRFASHADLEIQGTLLAEGTAELPIVMEGVEQTPGAWDGLRIEGTEAAPNLGSRLVHVDIGYGGNYWDADLNLYRANVHLEYVRLHSADGDGIHGSTGGTAELHHVILENNSGYAAYFTDGSLDPLLEGVTGQGNGTNSIALGGGMHDGNHLWEKTGLDYEIRSDHTVPAGTNLIIEPGVAVRFAGSADLEVRGTLLAEGTAELPIVMEGVEQTPGAWDGLRIEGTEAAPNLGSRLIHVDIGYGGNYWDADLNLYRTNVHLEYVRLHSADGDGIHGSTGGTAELHHVILENNSGYAAYFTDGSLDPVLEDVTGQGNGTNSVALGGGTHDGNHLWEKTGLDYEIRSDHTVPAGTNLVIEPGVVVRFASSADLEVQGTLLAEGTAELPIVMEGVEQTPGAWDGLRIEGTAAVPNHGSRLKHVDIGYGGNYWDADLNLYRANVRLEYVRLHSADGDGIHGSTGGTAELHHVILENNSGYAAYFTDGSLDPVLEDVTGQGNGTNSIALGGGTHDGNHLWEKTGLDYEIRSDHTVPLGTTLIIEPGVVVRFAGSADLEVRGTLRAIGIKDNQITFTGTVNSSGAWDGIRFTGTEQYPSTGNVLDNVLIEYGGNYWDADINQYWAQVHVRNSTIRSAQGDLVRLNHAAGSVYERTRFEDVDPEGNAINNRSDEYIMAAFNWWGSPDGPKSTCSPQGQGASVLGPVATGPHAVSPTIFPDLNQATQWDIITMIPQRWFVPADGTTRLWVLLKLTDCDGNPIPGRQIRLSSSLGQVVDGGLTGIDGTVYANVRSSHPGEAVLKALIDQEDNCQPVNCEETTVVFQDAASAGLLEGAEAPYLDTRFTIDPRPVTRGVSTTLRAELNNPMDFDVVVNLEYSFMQRAIGLTAGPVAQASDIRIPAESSTTVESVWIPEVSGHYCVRAEYSAHAFVPGPSGVGSDESDEWETGSSLSNLSVAPGPMFSESEKEELEYGEGYVENVEHSFLVIHIYEALEHGSPVLYPSIIFDELLNWTLDLWKKACEALRTDPPRLDYDVYAMVEPVDLPPWDPPSGMPPALKEALDHLLEESYILAAELQAAEISLDRYSGAAEANNLTYASQQACALSYYTRRSGNTMLRVVDAWNALLTVWRAEGFEIDATAGEIAGYQDRLRNSGYTEEEIAAALAAGFSDDAIEERRLDRISWDPETLTGDPLTSIGNYLPHLRALGLMLSGEETPSSRVLTSDAAASNLVRVHSSSYEIPVKNTTSQTANIEIRVRPIDLPPGWTACAEPGSIELSPGETGTVALLIDVSSAVPAGSFPRVAVEGWINGELLGGVVQDILVPESVALLPENTDIQLEIIPSGSLKLGESATVRAKVTVDGVPESGVMVYFTSSNPEIAVLSPRSSLTDTEGVAEVSVSGNSHKKNTAMISAAVVGKEPVSQALKVMDEVNYFGLGIFIILLIVFILTQGRTLRWRSGAR